MTAPEWPWGDWGPGVTLGSVVESGEKATELDFFCPRPGNVKKSYGTRGHVVPLSFRVADRGIKEPRVRLSLRGNRASLQPRSLQTSVATVLPCSLARGRRARRLVFFGAAVTGTRSGG